MCIKFGPTKCKAVLLLGHARRYNEPRRYNMETGIHWFKSEYERQRFESHGLWGWQGHIIVGREEMEQIHVNVDIYV